MDTTKIAQEKYLSSKVLAKSLPKLKKLEWISVVGNHICSIGLKKLVKTIATMHSIKKVCLEENACDGETIEYCLKQLKDLPHLRCISFTNPCCNSKTIASMGALKWNILRPFQFPFAFPAIQQLRLLGCGDCHLNNKSHAGEEREKFEMAIRQGIKQLKPYCSVEF